MRHEDSFSTKTLSQSHRRNYKGGTLSNIHFSRRVYIVKMIKAEDLLHNSSQAVSPLTQQILRFCQMLDETGAWTWKYRDIAITTVGALFVVRSICHKKGGIDWYALLHALVSGLGSLACIYLDWESAYLTGTPEPLRSMQCQGPMTSLHRILPAITLGYSLFDLADGFNLSFDFVLHGGATGLVMLYFCYYDAPHLLGATLTVEVSTIFLTMVRAEIFPDAVSIANMGMFVVTFFLFRILLFPFLWFVLVSSMWVEKNNETYSNCFPPSMIWFSFTIGLVFHILNFYWFYKILKKVERKISGKEGTRAGNDLKEEEHRPNGEYDKKNA